MERIIKFPLPDYIKIVDNFDALKIKPYCICYQYNVDNMGYGPYGFETDFSEKILNHIWASVEIWDKERIIPLKSFQQKRGDIFFTKKTKELELEINNVKKYQLIKKKNTLLNKKDKQTISINNKPILLDLFNENRLLKTSSLNYLLNLNIYFYIRRFYSPEAGDTFIIFENNVLDKIIRFTKNSLCNFLEISSINNLKPW